MVKTLSSPIGMIAIFFIIIGVFMTIVVVMILVFDMNSLSDNNNK